MLLSENFDSCYKKASGRLRLLQQLRPYLTTSAALRVYQSMIVPLITNSCNLKPLTNTQIDKLGSLDRRAENIIRTKPTCIANCINRDVCLLVKKCLLKSYDSETFNNYFTITEHATRNNLCLIRLPRVRLETARQAFFFCWWNCL